MKLFPLSNVLCRTPVFFLNSDIQDLWSELKENVKDSSPEFFSIIENLSLNDLRTSDDKIRFTVWKYFNRSTFRATPFGRFAAVTLTPTFNRGTTFIQVSDKIICHELRDWPEVELYVRKLANTITDGTELIRNSSIYELGDELRYLSFIDGVFHLSSIKSTLEIKRILTLSENKITKLDLLNSFEEDHSHEHTRWKNILTQMIKLQLVLTDRLPNITGEDYFERIKQATSHTSPKYIIAERRLIAGGLNRNTLDFIAEAANFMATIIPNQINPTLDDFRYKFLAKFEGQEVSLARVMDPEIGISYGELEHQTDDSYHPLYFSPGLTTRKSESVEYSVLHQFMLERLINKEKIDLAEYPIDTKLTDVHLPNTLSAVVYFHGPKIVLESLGGVTANSILGRFTMASEAIEKEARLISKIEKDANPDVIFFDVAYQAEKNIDNVNRRKALYDLELPILAWSCMPDSLSLTDIMVSIKGGEVVLRSKKFNKRLIPRLPSAYNFRRSDLSVYRFLADVQSQGLKTDLLINLSSYFPNLKHYPRIYFKDVIISPAMWQIPDKLFRRDCDADQFDILKAWLVKNQIDSWFKAGQSDNMLVFDPKNYKDLKAFLMLCRQDGIKPRYISESLQSSDSIVSNEDGKKYSYQLVVNLFHTNKIYKGSESIRVDPATPIVKKRNYLPSSEWLYFKIYCHPVRSNELLATIFSKFIRQVNGELVKWFFIRYKDEHHHLRIRLHLKDKSKNYEIISKLRYELEPYSDKGLIQDFSINTYFKEIGRYGNDQIELVENFFYADSKYVISIVHRRWNNNHLYGIALDVIGNIILRELSTLSEQIKFLKEKLEIFSKELNMTREQIKALNKIYKDNKTIFNTSLSQLPKRHFQLYKNTLTNLLDSYPSSKYKQQVLGDLIHMHINRLFVSDQRKHEAMIYHFLLLSSLAKHHQRTYKTDETT